ncbi:hypothetical protein CONLIGDRAFT_688029 [Coniochaeta ligniaria NRRL 30616]|uniref:Amidoligase enzyme n=1 Tax=Coniochaeta ligniaria NRRL 30616 TaxID=1408157 RepID=A0A1J7J4I7_9PEZI|nr:hypothetical protein CONLIGDRAFT_688029 [Coniochaeta ligniaria NRRL 30616]
MSGDALLSFGVEVEMLLTPKTDETVKDRYDLATAIADYHNSQFNTSNDLKMLALREGSEMILNKEGFKVWGLVNDGTVIPPKDSGQFSMELTSPILDFDQGGDWRDHVRKALCSVEALAQINTNISCGTHVHISPGRGLQWTEDELREISHAIIFFEGAFLKLVLESRRDNANCKSNGLGIRLAGKKPELCWERLLKHTSRDQLIRAMNPDDRFYAWNFRNMFPESEDGLNGEHCNGYTLEWRLAPGVTTAEGCLMWTELALNFVQVARQPGAHEMLVDKKKRTVECLGEFIANSMDERVSDKRYLKPVFEHKSGRFSPVEYGSNKIFTDTDEEDKHQQEMLEKLRQQDNAWR